MQGMSFGPADLAASRRMKTTRVGGGHPGYRVLEDPDPDDPEAPRATAQQDLWHYSIGRMVDACTSTGILPFYGPFGDIKDVAGLRGAVPGGVPDGLRRRLVAAPGADRHRQEGVLPDPEEVRFAKKVIEAIPDGRGVHMIDGKMQDDATWKQCKVMVDLAEQLAEKDPELAEAYGARRAGPMRAAERPDRPPRRPCASTSTSRAPIVERGGDPGHRVRLRHDRRGGREIAERIGGPVVIKSQVLTGGRMKAGGVKFADTPTRPPSARRGDPRPRDRRPHAARRAGGRPRPGQAGVLRGRHLGRHAQAPGAALLRHGRHRHRGGGREHPDHIGRGHFSNLLPFSDFQAKQAVASPA